MDVFPHAKKRIVYRMTEIIKQSQRIQKQSSFRFLKRELFYAERSIETMLLPRTWV
ncbi:MAG: hypothetical protein ACLT0Y_00955 [Christensenellales bacterium]